MSTPGSVTAHAPAGAWAPAAPDAVVWVRRANDRPRGATEFREVTLEIGEGRMLRLRTLRQTEGDVARVVFCVMAPSLMENINYTATEHRGRIEPFAIQLYLPYVEGTLLDVPPARRGEGLLGSDFCYDDFREWLPEADHVYSSALGEGGRVRVTGRRVDGPPLSPAGGGRFDVWIDRETAFVSGIDYRGGGDALVREFRVDETAEVDGVVVPARMSMHDRPARHRTVVRLERAWIGRGVDPAVWAPEFRPRTRDYLATL
jgi:hypothetical protein